ncbi:MAG TPA: protein-disulfide reductase DsbD domain-containing protein, partial [Bryobacteraceae bacterium]|nr:protein-disulfide reductase DsbD domain-containing protein [Bryobacteraceae bacterium]
MVLRLTASIDPGWHLYSLSTPKGPIPTTVRLADTPAVAGYATYQPKPVVKFDPNFNLDTETFENKAEFVLDVELSPSAAPGPVALTAQVRYQACDEKQCLIPVRKT